MDEEVAGARSAYRHTLAGDTRGLTTIEYLIILCVVALLGFGAFRLLGTSLSSEVQAAGDDVGRIHISSSGQGRKVSAGSVRAGNVPTDSASGNGPSESAVGAAFSWFGELFGSEDRHTTDSDSESVQIVTRRSSTDTVSGISDVFGEEVGLRVAASPTLVAALESVYAEGWEVHRGRSFGGSLGYANPYTNNIVIDGRVSELGPAAVVQALAHETSHAMDTGLLKYGPPAGLDKEAWVANELDSMVRKEVIAETFAFEVNLETRWAGYAIDDGVLDEEISQVQRTVDYDTARPLWQQAEVVDAIVHQPGAVSILSDYRDNGFYESMVRTAWWSRNRRPGPPGKR